ncbi:MAG: DUF1194 domain-containing protein, partial [Roseobacter sp.]
LLLWPLTAHAQTIEVDVELFLAVDVSRSMTEEELDIQRLGYADALTSPEVLSAIQNGLLGRIAVTYVEWAGTGAHRVIVPWQILATAEQAEEIATTIVTTQGSGMQRTSISGALGYASTDFASNGFTGLRRVIDVSGDGPNNQGTPVVEARDIAIAQGFIINGLPLMTQDALSHIWGIPDLDDYYVNCVIGGPGSFSIPVLEWKDFAPAVKRKLILEISHAPSLVIPVQYAAPAPYDCLIGEKNYEKNRRYFEEP